MIFFKKYSDVLNFTFLSFGTFLHADTIGYVDMQRVFQGYNETKKAEEKFKEGTRKV